MKTTENYFILSSFFISIKYAIMKPVKNKLINQNAFRIFH